MHYKWKVQIFLSNVLYGCLNSLLNVLTLPFLQINATGVKSTHRSILSIIEGYTYTEGSDTPVPTHSAVLYNVLDLHDPDTCQQTYHFVHTNILFLHKCHILMCPFCILDGLHVIPRLFLDAIMQFDVSPKLRHSLLLLNLVLIVFSYYCKQTCNN